MFNAQYPKPYNDFCLSLRGGKPIWQTTHDTVRHITKIEVVYGCPKIIDALYIQYMCTCS